MNLKKIFVVVVSLALSPSASADQTWLGKPWKLSQLRCPFGCSKGLQSEFLQSKAKEVIFESDRAVLPDVIGACKSPAKPKWDTLQPVNLGSYLATWSNGEKNKSAQSQKNLIKKLEINSKDQVLAGVVHCSDDSGFNLIVINPNRAFLFFEENSYFELVR